MSGPGEDARVELIGSPGPALVAALVRAARAVKPVAKDSRNDYSGYDYASSEAIFVEACGALTGAGIAPPLPIGAELVGDPSAPELQQRWLLAHESGQSVELRTTLTVTHGAKRPKDKAVLGARTTSLAYLLRDILLIPRGIEVDGDPDAGAAHPSEVGRSRRNEFDSGARRVSDRRVVWERLQAARKTLGEEAFAPIAGVEGADLERWKPSSLAEATLVMEAAERAVQEAEDVPW